MANKKWASSPEISGHYEVINTESPILHSKIGDVDFRKITLEQANRIFELGTSYLKKVKPKDKEKSTENKKEL